VRWYECFDCGRQLSADDVQRYEVARRSVSRGRISKRHQRVNLCRACVAKRDRWSLIPGIALLALIALIVAALLYLFILR
jgi:hypothetical protein